MKIIGEREYQYQNAPIPGGGYVTGLMYHQEKEDIFYARTDIGGVYRFDPVKRRWHSLIDHVTTEQLDETFPIACALDDNHPKRLYIASGVNGKGCGTLSISEDYGEHFTYETIPVTVHGNLCGRGTGFRLVVDKNDSEVLYFASQLDGLLRSTDRGKTWEKLSVPEDYMTFVWVSDDSKTIVAGTAGYTTRESDAMRGHSLYVSYDAGANFEQLTEPENTVIEGSKMSGLVAARYDYDGTYLYITMNVTGRWNYVVDLGYSCDSGDVMGGKVLRYCFKDGKIVGYKDITPDGEGKHTSECLNYGFGGISSCKAKPGLLVCTTLCREKVGDECVYLSYDYGNSWSVSLDGLQKGDLSFRASYMRPEFNGGRSLLHWMSDIKINPFNPNEVWFNSGTGVFTTGALLSKHPRYHDWCDGIEETVHLNVYAPVNGDVKVVDIVGDLGGFAFRDLHKPCRNSFDDPEGNRYITCINAEVSDLDSRIAIISARGNWTGKTKGGLIETRDGFRTFKRLKMPFGINEHIDKALKQIENPNVNPGWVAMSPDGMNIVWSIADGIRLPVDMVIASHDGGKTFEKVFVYDRFLNPVLQGFLKVFGDRMKPELFFGFGGEGQIYVSLDGGRTFYEKVPDMPKDQEGKEIEYIPKSDFGYIDTANKTEVHGEGGKSGVLYMALAKDGLWKLVYWEDIDRIVLTRLTKEGDICYRMGLGLLRPDVDYRTEKKMIYLCGVIDGSYGFYRTNDEGRTFLRLNQAHQMYGEINSIDGDKRHFGRFYIATGSRGILYGEDCEYERVRAGQSWV
ncbi:MAG: endoglucanase [Lachnospiraceae bacterium]|nr:endoglucanase [Lachnospiraceae bacterium]